IHYANIDSRQVSDHDKAMEDLVLGKPSLARLLRQTPIAYIWDDHDFTGNDADGSAPGRLAARLSYQRLVPHYPLVFGSGDVPIDQAFTAGRVRFILSDLRSEKVKGGAPWSEAQKNWFKGQVLNARDRHLMIAWVSSYSFSGNEKDNWGGHELERTALCDWLMENKIANLMILSGDAHMIAMDNGSNSDFSTGKKSPFRYPIFQAAGLANRGSDKGGIYSEGGTFPNPEIPRTDLKTADGKAWYYTASSYGQFGMVRVVDMGGEFIEIKFEGFRVDGNSGETSKLVEYSFKRKL
ncbi:MAG: hypothetical protein JNM63_19750, partial [Spirochaetia bacterium]|nr:hypothetical protein [Spirochaetia bacterium]